MEWSDYNWSMADFSETMRHAFFGLCAIVSAIGLIIWKIETED